jgi:hypothetical protein
VSRAVEAAPETESWVRALVAHVADRPVRAIIRIGYGHGSVTYRVDVDGPVDSAVGNAVIVRTNTDPGVYAGTLSNLDTLRGIGLPVPTVLAADLTMGRYPFAYVMTDTFPGRDLGFELAGLSGRQMTRIAEQIVGFERTASALPRGHGYGFMPIGASGCHRRWVEAVRADRGWLGAGGRAGAGAVALGDVSARAGVVAGLGVVAGAGRDTGLADACVAEVVELIADVRVTLDRSERRLEAIEPICFLDDLTTKNVIVHDGILHGVVDFDVVCYGDPMYWLALTQVAIMQDVGTRGRFYVDELTRLWNPSAFEWANLALYSALHAAEFLSWTVDDPSDTATERRARLMRTARSWIAAAV